MTKSPRLVLGFLVTLAGTFACDKQDGGDLGSPCDAEEDCAEGLICDVHGSQGSCQEPHDHDDDHAESSESGE